jgi:hypothetical protein
MLNPLKIATDGYLKRQTKAVLIIAVAGYLNFTDVPPTPPPSGGGSGYTSHYNQEQREREDKKRIEIEDSELIAVVELTLKHFII